MTPTPPADDHPGTAAQLERLGLDDIDPQALVDSSSFCSMVHAAHQLGHEISGDLAALGLSDTLYLVLGAVFAQPGSTPADLARACAMSPQHLGGVLDQAEARGLVVRGGRRGRGRPTHVEVTDDGIRLLVAGWPVVHGAGAERLSPGQHRVLQSLLRQLRGTAGAPGDDVVLVDEAGNDAGTAPRLAVHTTDTPLHRAFSTHLVRDDGRVLLTRRALSKRTWPGVWTNSACGHLLPGETPVEAALRRVPQELGVVPTGLRVVLPDFRYRATDASGVVENELCPVMVGHVDAAALDPDPDEVAEHAWATWDEVRALVASAPFAVSPWAVRQVRELGERPW